MFKRTQRQTPVPVQIREVTVERSISTVVITGSSVRGVKNPGDVDAFCTRFGEAEEAIVRAWMLGRGLDVELPLDVHENPGVETWAVPVPVPFGTEPALIVLHQGEAQVKPWVPITLASALRGEALAPGAFAAWRAQVTGVKIHLGSSAGVYGQHDATEDPWEGVTAVTSALRHCPGGEALIRSLPYGDRIMEAVASGPQRLALGDNKGNSATPAPWLRISFGRGAECEIR